MATRTINKARPDHVDYGVDLQLMTSLTRKLTEQGKFFGPEQVYQAFGVEIMQSQLPPLPPQEVMEWIGQCKARLILRIGFLGNRSSLTPERMFCLMDRKLSRQREYPHSLLLHQNSQGSDRVAFVRDRPCQNIEWAVVAQEPWPVANLGQDAFNLTKNLYIHLQQSGLELFWDKKALVEFERQRAKIAALRETNPAQADQMIAELSMTKKYRRTMAQALYDGLLTLLTKYAPGSLDITEYSAEKFENYGYVEADFTRSLRKYVCSDNEAYTDFYKVAVSTFKPVLECVAGGTGYEYEYGLWPVYATYGRRESNDTVSDSSE